MPKNLLLADDSITIQKVVGITFAGEDFKVTAVDNGDDALTRARELRPDVILADVVMPKRNGYEVCEAVKGDPSLAHIPVLLLSGTFEAFDEERARQARADGHLAKPFESQALIDRVKALVGLEPSSPRAAQGPARPAPAPQQGPQQATRPAAPAPRPAPAPAAAMARPQAPARPVPPGAPPRPGGPLPPGARPAAPGARPPAGLPGRPAAPAAARPGPGFPGFAPAAGAPARPAGPAPQRPAAPAQGVARPGAAPPAQQPVPPSAGAPAAGRKDPFGFGVRAPAAARPENDWSDVQARDPAARPAPSPAAEPPRAGNGAAPSAASDEVLLRDLLSRASREVIEKVVWEVVPELAEMIIRENLDRLVKARQG